VRSLRRAEGVWTSGKDGPGIVDDVAALSPAQRGWDGNRLTLSDIDAEVVRELRERLKLGLTEPGLKRTAPDTGAETETRWVSR
jgi:hypothetical protein